MPLFLLNLYCATFLSASCQVATLTNTIMTFHDANPVAVAAILGGEDKYQGLISNSKMLLEQDEIITNPRPYDPNYIRPVDGTNFQVPTSTAVVVEKPRLFLDAGSPYSVFDAPKY